MDALKDRFNEDMLEIYEEAKNIGYTPSYFWRMIKETSGYDAAKKLILETTDGFTKFEDLGRLDLSVEAYVVKLKYKGLFTDKERELCVKRLNEAKIKYTVK